MNSGKKSESGAPAHPSQFSGVRNTRHPLKDRTDSSPMTLEPLHQGNSAVDSLQFANVSNFFLYL